MRYFAIMFYLTLHMLLVEIAITFAQPGGTDSWPQFRGPNRNGCSPETDLPDVLPAAGPELLWKRAVGSGFSEIVIAGERIYTLLGEQADSTTGVEYLGAFDAATGDEIWRCAIDSLFFDQFGNGPRSTPLVHDQRVYCLSSYGKLSGHDLADGRLLWQSDLVAEFGSTLPRWGFSTSPVLVDGAVILEAGGTGQQGFTGFDPESGKVLWATGTGMAGYSSPVVAELDGKNHVIFSNQTTLYAFDAGGDSLWTHTMSMNWPMATPVVFDSNKIFISTVRSEGFSIVEVKDGAAKEVLRGETMKNDFSSSVCHGGYVYGFDVAALQCISAATGQKMWMKRGFGKGSLILVDGSLLVLSDKGKLIQVKAAPDGYMEQGSFQALEGKSWTAPSYAGGKLFVRNLTEMACYKLK